VKEVYQKNRKIRFALLLAENNIFSARRRDFALFVEFCFIV